MDKVCSPPADLVRKLTLWGIPVLFVVGGLMHFAYKWSGDSVAAGIFTPINESVWEHLKMAFWPVLIWWLAVYLLNRQKHGIPAAQWFLSCVTSELVCLLTIVCFFYTYTGAFGIELLGLDIFSLFLGIGAGQLAASHVYRYAKLHRYDLYVSIALLVLLAAAFTVFTFDPPLIPAFRDSVTGAYGI